MIKLREYQIEAIDAAAHAFKSHKSALIVASTGSGKSLISAGICQRVLERHPSWRILVLCYVQEILESNHQACLSLGVTSSGIYCTGAGRKDTEQSVIHASRDSLGSKPEATGKYEMIIVDEVHMLSADVDSRYQKIIAHLAPRYLLGMTATPYRLDGGFIYGKRKTFLSVCYEIGMDELVKRGALAPFVFPKAKKLVDASGVTVKKGEFDSREIELLTDNDQVIEASMAQWALHAGARRCSLFFCHSVEHGLRSAKMFVKMFPQFSCAFLDGMTKKAERFAIVEGAKAGRFKAIFNIGVLGTGTNIPMIDCVVWMRPTMSAVLFVQGSGRGSRLSPGKLDCMVLDLVGNMDRFGSISNPILPVSKGNKKAKFTDEELLEMGIDPQFHKGACPTKQCPDCKAELHAAAKKCNDCGKLFITVKKAFDGTAQNNLEVLSATGKYTVTSTGEMCFICTYTTLKGEFKEWILYKRAYERTRYHERKAMISTNQVASLEVTHNPSRPKYPKLSPSRNQISSH